MKKLPPLIRELVVHGLISEPPIAQIVTSVQKRFANAPVEELDAVAEANKQALVLKLRSTMELQVQIMVLEEMSQRRVAKAQRQRV